METSLLVLANSYKNHHRCIAGIDLGVASGLGRCPGRRRQSVRSKVHFQEVFSLVFWMSWKWTLRRSVQTTVDYSVLRKIAGLIQHHDELLDAWMIWRTFEGMLHMRTIFTFQGIL